MNNLPEKGTKEYALADALSRPNAMNGLYRKLKLPLEWENLNKKDAIYITNLADLADRVIQEAIDNGKDLDDVKAQEELRATFYGGSVGTSLSVSYFKYKLLIFGIITYILSVISSAKDLQGNYTASTTIIALSVITTMIFTIMATVRLWKIAKITSILLFVFSLLNLVLSSTIIHWISFLVFLWAMCLLWEMTKREKNTDSSASNTLIE
ncbi:hypothetical protein M0Q39_04360 [Patescibacteria group bacterium]|nr:hypothetical protein [Patescibacteria group bacterium]MDD2287935.1 hypothetical protein [Bacteroidales bacterium]